MAEPLLALSARRRVDVHLKLLLPPLFMFYLRIYRLIRALTLFESSRLLFKRFRSRPIFNSSRPIFYRSRPFLTAHATL